MPVVELKAGNISTQKASRSTLAFPEPECHVLFVDSPSLLASLLREIPARFHQEHTTRANQYHRFEVRLPVSDMRPWYWELPGQLRQLPEITTYWLLRLTRRLHLLPRSAEVPNIWKDFKLQPTSWLNSLLVHIVAVTALLLPYLIVASLRSPKTSETTQVVEISPYLPEIPPSSHKAGGGGGGGDRTPTPPSQGALPRFAPEQFTPPEARIPNPQPKLPMAPTLIGPPELKLPQMVPNMLFGDPTAVLGSPSNGPGAFGGIGTGSGGGVGSGTGGGVGPGEGGGVGGGVYEIGGNVSAPIPIYEPDPTYSEEARKAKYSAVVILRIIVDLMGNVSDAQVVKSAGLGLDEKAIEAVRTWKFKPALRNEKPVKVRVVVEVHFRLF